MKLTVNFCIANINETKKEVIEVYSNLKSTQPNPEYKTSHKQMTINKNKAYNIVEEKNSKISGA